MVPTQIVTIYEPYDTRRTKTAYWNKLKTSFRLVNGTGEGVEYSIRKSTHGHVIIQHNNDTIFITDNRPYSIRNLYLELHSCQYDVAVWYVRRNQSEFNSENYRSEGLRPEQLLEFKGYYSQNQ